MLDTAFQPAPHGSSIRADRPQISIIMPSYNQGRYVDEAIRSVLNQPLVAVQLIIMDGGSTDDTAAMVARHRDHIDVFRSEPDRGQSHALNKALDFVRAPIVGWLNSDDRYRPGCFRQVLQAFADDPEVVMVHGDRIMIDGASSICGWSRTGPFDPTTGVYNICSETAFWRHEAAAGLHFAEELRFTMDVKFFGTLAQRGRTAYLPRFLGDFRCHPESKSSTLWHDVAIPEGRRTWIELFGSEPRMTLLPEQQASDWDRVRDLALNPLSLGLGYLRYRLRRWMGRQGHGMAGA